MADQQVTPSVNPPVSSPVTSPTPATKQKNPKRVAAGKAIAAKTKAAREAQKIALIRAESIIAKNSVPQPADPQPADPQPVEPQPADPQPVAKDVLSTTQWLSVMSIVVSLAGIYYKREEIKGFLTKKPPTVPQAPPPSPDPPRLDFLFFVHIPCRNLTLLKRQSELSPSVQYL